MGVSCHPLAVLADMEAVAGWVRAGYWVLHLYLKHKT